jgi:short subunit dehydrogenase-like uncharacterized protein
MTPARTPTETKLSKLRDALAEDRGEAPAPDLLHADVGDQASLRELANSTRVLVSTVGPYAVHGRGVVGACAAAGTDYLDLTGEPEVRRLDLLHPPSRRAGIGRPPRARLRI